MTLSEERLAQIEQRHHEFTTFSGEAGAKWGDHEERLYTLARDDVPALVAEVRRLKAELDQMANPWNYAETILAFMLTDERATNLLRRAGWGPVKAAEKRGCDAVLPLAASVSPIQAVAKAMR